MADEPEVEEAPEAAPSGPLSPSDFRPSPSGGEAQEPAAAAPEAPAAAEPATIRSLVKSLGYEFGPDVADDYQALVNLTNRARQAEQLEAQARQADVYRQLGQQLAPRAQELGKFFQDQQKPQGPKAYEPPEFDERWSGLVDRDQNTGLYVGKPGTPPELVNKVNAWADWQQKFQRDPIAVIRPLLEEQRTATLEAMRQELRQTMEAQQREAQVMQIARRNADWAYAKDAAGNWMPDPLTGGPSLTPLGRQYIGLVQSLAQRGVQDPAHRDELARALLAAQAPPQATEAQNRALPAGRRQINPLQALGAQARRETPGATEPDVEGLSLAEVMRREFEQAGVTDRDFKGDHAFSGGGG